MAILMVVSASEDPVSADDLFPKLEFQKATVHRLMLLLESPGFLQREPGSKRFMVSLLQTAIALETLINSLRRAIRHAIVRSLVDEVQETCNVAMLAGSEVIYVDRVESHWPLRTQFKFTEKTVIDRNEIKKELKLIRQSRIRLHREEFLQDLIGVAVSVFDKRRRMCATVSMHVPTVCLNAEQALSCVPAMKRVAVAIAKTLSP